VGMTPGDVRSEIASLLNGSEAVGEVASNGAHRSVKAPEPAAPSKSSKPVAKSAKARKR
jgi:hypothetical protein